MKAAGQRFNRSRSWRGGGVINSEHSGDAACRSVFRLVLHLCFCFACLIVGFRLSRESLLVVLSLKNSDPYLHGASVLRSHSSDKILENRSLFQDPLLPDSEVKPSGLYHDDGVKSSRVHVGRHGILIRPWPHPDPVETMVAQSLIIRVQQEQRKLYGLSARRSVIVITPTYRRTCQAMHLTSLMNTLKLVPAPLLWIVVEAGERTSETAAILSTSGLSYHHLYLKDPMPAGWPERHRLATRLRIVGLRFIREHDLDGIVVFADESNAHRLELFDEVQKVEWVGAFSVGLLMPPQATDEGHELWRWNTMNVRAPTAGFLPVQGPACNDSGHLVGWHSESGNVDVVKYQSTMAPNFEWAGFALSSAAILDGIEKPSWIKDFEEWVPDDGRAVSLTSIASDESYIEPLGDCGRRILAWWARIDARSDSKYPERWVTEQPLEVVVPAKSTPWPPTAPPPPINHTLLAERRRAAEELALAEKKRQAKQSRKGKSKKKPSKEES
ncbi:unnamed protein product [Calypogeia fissa]